jgi:hypothetical protein
MLESLKNKLELYRTEYHNLTLMIKSTTKEDKKKTFITQRDVFERR